MVVDGTAATGAGAGVAGALAHEAKPPAPMTVRTNPAKSCFVNISAFGRAARMPRAEASAQVMAFRPGDVYFRLTVSLDQSDPSPRRLRFAASDRLPWTSCYFLPNSSSVAAVIDVTHVLSVG